MKRKTVFTITLILLAALLSAPTLFGQETYDSPLFTPVTPEVTAQGNSFTAVAHGYNALFTNPAGFAREGGSFTLLSTNATAYVPPDKVGELPTIMGDPLTGLTQIEDTVLKNGIGAAASAGTIGIVGKGFGLGIASNLDFYGRPVGRTVGSTEIDVSYTTGIVAGAALPLNLLGTKVYLGGDLKYMKRIDIRDMGFLTFMKMAEGGSDPSFPDSTYSGEGFGFDVGAIAEMGSFTAGVSIRDLFGTDMGYTRLTNVSTPEDVLTYPTGDPIEGESYVIPMSLNIGGSWHPDLGGLSFLFDPTLHADWQHVMWKESQPNFWTQLHAGAEVKVLRFIKLRGGINQGYLTMGAGVKLLFLDVNVAFFGREMSDWPGVKPSQGVALEAAIRF
jgi:hypothetical protein